MNEAARSPALPASAKILFVDDESDLRALLTQMFRHQIRRGDYAFLFAEDGQQALDILADHPDVDVILCDINMPKMDGLTLLRRLDELEGGFRSVVVSAYGDMANIRSAMNLGAFDFVTKPIDSRDLEITIDKSIADVARVREARKRQEDAERARANLSRYFSPNLAGELATNSDLLSIGGSRRQMSFVFTGFSDFGSLLEAGDPKLVIEVLNEYLDGIASIIFAHGGMVEKVDGGSVDAMFGAPVEQSDHAERAVAVARAIDAYSVAFRTRHGALGIDRGVTHIGVHTGSVIVGNFGGESFFRYTAHGDAINTAARLKAANAHLGTRMCVSEATAGQVPGFAGRRIGDLLLRGKSELLTAYEPLPDEQHDTPAAHAYQTAFDLLEAGDPRARRAFASLVGEHGDDNLATFHLRRLLAGESGTRIRLG